MRIAAPLVMVPVVVAALGCTPADPVPGVTPQALRVCADPNNLPFSNEKGEGFENRLAELLADELDLELRYTWWPQRRGFVRNTLGAGLCDVMMTAPVDFDAVMTTTPYYTSTYVALWRDDRDLAIHSFDDPRLRTLRVGVQIVGDDGANPPPAHALSSRGIVENVVGFTVYGDYAQPNPPARIVDAVADGTVDVAFVWGPLAGYFASRAAVPLAVRPISGDPRNPELPLSYAIAVGVRRGDAVLRNRIDEALVRRRGDIEALLTEFGVPRVS
jgi:mxaJ protein